jgi:hypothetical protein
MSFATEIRAGFVHGCAAARVDVELGVLGTRGRTARPFQFDTGSALTTVSEDVATALGLPTGGAPVSVRGSAGATSARLVAVTFRFTPDEISGTLEPDVTSTWIVVPGATHLALLSLHDVHEHFALWTDDTHLYFTNR